MRPNLLGTGSFISALGAIAIAIGACKPSVEERIISLDTISEDYVKLALRIGQYDADFIDAYYGPDEWKPTPIPESDSSQFPYEEFKWQAIDLIANLEEMEVDQLDSFQMMRLKFLHKQLIAINTKVDMIYGERLPFDVESRSLYDAVSPHQEEEYYQGLLSKLDKILPGRGPVADRFLSYSQAFIISDEKLDTVFKTAISEAKRRTSQYLDLPANESFEIEYVTDKSWSGYNWYKGNGHSLIQINTDFPIYIERAIDLACHEGYPGHHVYNAMLEEQLVNKRNWREFSVYALFSPQSLVAEGSANYGIDMAFPGPERRKFEKDVLFPLAGLDSSEVDRYYDILELRSELNYAGNEAARQYLNGQITREKAAEWLVRFNLNSYERALQRTRFFDQYRSYVINYNYGKDLIKNYVEREGGIASNPERRWEIFEGILSSPLTASSLE